MPRNALPGFTLSELLISLAILAVIAAFTVPKILLVQQGQQFNAVAKEDVAAISAAFQQLRMNGTLSSSTSWADVTPYINFAQYDTSSGNSVDAQQTQTTYACTGTRYCLRMHNGSIIIYRRNISFGGTNTTNALHVHIDPDGRVTDGTTDGPGKSAAIFFYYNGRVADEGGIDANTQNNSGTYNPGAASVPPWLSW